MFSLHRLTPEPLGDRHPRRSFTLIELLMVIVIIGVLMALAFAGYQAVMLQARVAEIKVEIDGMASALADFKAKFGFYPPSRIIISEDPADFFWPTTSRAVIRRMFPQFNFNGRHDFNGDGSTAGADIDGDGTPDGEPFVLTGAECLVFFLGGAQQGGVPIGYSNNPGFPFSQAGSNRLGPFFNFDAGRVTDVDNDGMSEFVSPLTTQTTPYLYVSSYNGRGYASPRDDIRIDLDVFPATPSNPNPLNMVSVYLQASAPWNRGSFQIICPGFDDLYGLGGLFDPDSADLDLNTADFDNITNFHPGMLVP